MCFSWHYNTTEYKCIVYFLQGCGGSAKIAEGDFGGTQCRPAELRSAAEPPKLSFAADFQLSPVRADRLSGGRPINLHKPSRYNQRLTPPH